MHILGLTQRISKNSTNNASWGGANTENFEILQTMRVGVGPNTEFRKEILQTMQVGAPT